MTLTFELENIMKKLLAGNPTPYYDFYKMTIEEVYFHCALMTNDAEEARKLVIKVYRTLYLRISRLDDPRKVAEWYNATLFEVLNGWVDSKCISLLVQEENGAYKRPMVSEAYPDNASVNTMFTESETANLAATYINKLDPVLAMTCLAYYFDNLPDDQIAKYTKLDGQIIVQRTKYALSVIAKECVDYAWANKVEIQRVDVHVLLLAYMALFKVTTAPNKDEVYALVCEAINK